MMLLILQILQILRILLRFAFLLFARRSDTLVGAPTLLAYPLALRQDKKPF